MASAALETTPISRPTAESPPKTVRVLHVINGEHYAGAERVQDLLSLHLAEHGFEVGLACLKPGSFVAMRQARHVPLYPLPMKGRFDLSVVWKLVRIIRKEHYELIHSHTPRSALVAALASAITGVHLVHHVHSPTQCDTERPWQNRINTLVERLGLQRASAVIAVSDSLGRLVRGRKCAAGKVHVVPNGVAARPPVPLRNPEKTEWTLGVMALLRPRKGLETMLDALARLRRQGFPVRLRAVGAFESPQYRERILHLSEKLGLTPAIDWTGFARDIDRELAQMDLFVLPSLCGEGLPMVILEAMSAGLPVVATRVEGIPEALRDGLEGLIVEPNDPRDLARAIAQIITGVVDVARLRAAALRRHAERFSAARMAADVAKIYRHVLDSAVTTGPA
ncbi:MAG: glycosyltransferase [Thermoguttaceae bacterium]|jgi:glycosyltransferase involved in cell wall biosynthesis